jgi:hypothetical protein
VNAAAVIGEVIRILHGEPAVSLNGFTEAELYTYLNRALDTAHSKAAFLSDTYTVASQTTPTFTLPSTAISLIDVAWDERSLRTRTAAQLDAAGDYWEQAISDDPETIVYEQQGNRIGRIVPIPTQPGELKAIFRAAPPEQNNLSSLTVPQIVDVIATLRTVETANSRDGRYQFPESAAFAGALSDILEAAASGYYGGSV